MNEDNIRELHLPFKFHINYCPNCEANFIVLWVSPLEKTETQDEYIENSGNWMQQQAPYCYRCGIKIMDNRDEIYRKMVRSELTHEQEISLIAPSTSEETKRRINENMEYIAKAYEEKGMKIPWKWEKLDCSTERARVPGGWLIRGKLRILGADGDYRSHGIAMASVPDPEHAWEVDHDGE